MNVREYIESVGNKLVSLFPEITEVYYEHRESAGVHFIKISNEEIFTDENFLELNVEVSTEFYEFNFPGMICFINDSSLVKLNNPELIYQATKELPVELAGFQLIHSSAVNLVVNTALPVVGDFFMNYDSLLSLGLKIPTFPLSSIQFSPSLESSGISFGYHLSTHESSLAAEPEEEYQTNYKSADEDLKLAA